MILQQVFKCQNVKKISEITNLAWTLPLLQKFCHHLRETIVWDVSWCFLMFVEIVQISSEVVLKSSQSQDQVVNRTLEYHSSDKIVFCTFLFHLFHFFLFTNLINKVEIHHNFCTFFALSHLLVPQLSEKLVEIKFASNLKVGRV